MEVQSKLWVLIEATAPVFARAGLELLTPGRDLADQSGQPLAAVVMGHGVQDTARQAAALGADEVLVLDHPAFAHYDTLCFSHALSWLMEVYHPSSLLLSATEHGRDLAPRVACRFRTGLTADCTQLSIREDGETILWTRPALGGNLMATIVCEHRRPQMGTVRPGVFSPRTPDPQRTSSILAFPQVPILVDSNVQTLQRLTSEGEAFSFDGKDVIVSGGLGMQSKENFGLIWQLAQALGGVVGASRGAVQEGWAPYSHQVGQSGATVRPKVYIACGISGAVQHLAGITGADTVIAINTDPNAPIFQAADYGLVGDALQVIPALLDTPPRQKSQILVDNLPRM